jgi:hypothetical protein
MRRKILWILVTAFLAAMTYPASGQTYEQLIAGGRTDVHLGQKEPEINETFRKLFR